MNPINQSKQKLYLSYGKPLAESLIVGGTYLLFSADNQSSVTGESRYTKNGECFHAESISIYEYLGSSNTDETNFRRWTNEWREQTGKFSMVHTMAMHPAYQKIIGMGLKALPFIFRELNARGGHWLWALAAITGRDDVPGPNDNFRQAVQAWIKWGQENGYPSNGSSRY